MKLFKEITQLILAILLMTAGASLTFNYLNGLLIIGILLLMAGMALLIRMVVVAR